MPNSIVLTSMTKLPGSSSLPSIRYLPPRTSPNHPFESHRIASHRLFPPLLIARNPPRHAQRPREMEVWGMVEGKDNIGRLKAWKDERAARKEMGQVDEYESVAYPKTLPKHPEYIRLANFTYDIHAPQYMQTFPVDPEVKALGIDFGIVALRVLNNWGRDEYTCLYRFRVHGQRIGEIPEPYSGRVEGGSDASS
ncbi:hypothetical protein NLJ89_g4374 [Agrocybe chaxingu]|uniref:SUN domain-containing protein n=1 Tax=Agrocybe chaxingu TaxID=84603 RepID=A0A9W8K2Z4_9AGAR|nr:hypothetical protein NLJ89_g4374 [Agrocybe chaxingu]